MIKALYMLKENFIAVVHTYVPYSIVCGSS